MTFVSLYQSLTIQPGLILSRDGPEFRILEEIVTLLESISDVICYNLTHKNQ
jgi:hypothetical protein